MANLIDHGSLGAKRATWHKANPRELLNEIIAKRPKAGAKAWRTAFTEIIEDDARQFITGELDRSESYFAAVIHYSFDNALLSLTRNAKPSSAERRQRKDVRAAASASVKGKLQQKVRQEARIILLNLGMPNGKTLGKCTGGECSQFGGWFVWLAKLVPHNDRVADTLTEDEVRQLWLARS